MKPSASIALPNSDPLPDSDTVKYPIVNPQVFLSVSDDAPSIGGTIKTPFAFYVEKFSLTHDLKSENEEKEPFDRYCIYTGELYGPELASKGCSIIISGKGGVESNPDAYQGGTLQIFAEHVEAAAVEKLHLDAGGGPGANRQPVTGTDVGPRGGNGGQGGRVDIVFGCIFEQAIEQGAELVKGLMDPKKKWPTDFENKIKLFVGFITLKEIMAAMTIPPSLNKVETMMATPKESIQPTLIQFLIDLAAQRDSLTNAFEQHTNVEGGPYGTGGMGDKQRGPNGDTGKPGSHSIYILSDPAKLLESAVCFVHPTQCRMLLDMANLLWFCGSLNEKARAANIYSRLTRRLAFLGDEKDGKISKTPLAEAYRKAEPSLFILGGAPGDEPISFTLLRAVKDEAHGNLLSLLSGKTIFGDDREKVPRGSFGFYQTAIAPLLTNLKEVETTYRRFLGGEMDAEEKKQAVRDRLARCDFRKRLVQDEIKEKKNDLDTNLQRLHLSTESIGPAKKSLMNAYKAVEKQVRTGVTVSWEDLMSALSQVIFVHGSAPMVALQGADLIHNALEKLKSDSSVSIDRSLLLHDAKDMKESIEGLAEGYTLLKDGGVDFDDPAATKLQVLAEKADAFWSQFENILGKPVLENLRKRFHDYIAIVKERNAAVIGYTEAVLLLIKYQTELDALAAERADISREEYDQLGADHPTMTAFMKKLYTDAIHTTQEWLYKAQRSYQFVSLDRANVVGEQMEGFKFSTFNSTTLISANSTLVTRYNAFIEKAGTEPQTFNGLRYDIDEMYVDMIQDSGTDGITHTIEIPVFDIHKPNPFGSMVDIRLTKVRFYLDGAKTKSHFMDLTLKHQGKETILNKQDERFDFVHDPLITKFRYNIDNPMVMGPGTTDGDVGSVGEDRYAKVGPFTQWTFQVTTDNNPGLSLGKVCKAYFMFWFTYYETM
ncbi:hypothetical protein TRV_07224 [Trichophyton verrucosum HKI 0517]|uniref:Serine protein kinase n=1 Tax=Trichophyton verrucosum (strain HKI 0517) TaxID=663202 RepID=D4DJ58_TRIVH|nr:uncharacterized protein TRV_07224 [Trichophyton verrucosum HKI 0517]EFE38117.1 hypothetical protein TRV_07224 [Trichophyton verrucosum HKI 0517]